MAGFLLTIPSQTLAQSTGSVASPVVKPGRSLGVAGALAVDAGDINFAHRIDYRQSVSDSVRFSVITFYNDRGGDYHFRRFALEAMHQLASDSGGWSSAVQVRGIIPDGDDGAPRLRLAWLNRWSRSDGSEFRFIGLGTQEFGQQRRAGLALETRSEATWMVVSGVRVGAQMFNRYNTTSDFGSFDTQRHSVGGVLKGSLTENASFRVNALTGISDAAADFELRMRVNLNL